MKLETPQKQLRGEKDYSVHNSELQSVISGKSQWQKLERTGRVTLQSGEENNNARTTVLSFVLDPVHELPTFRVGRLISINPIRKIQPDLDNPY